MRNLFFLLAAAALSAPASSQSPVTEQGRTVATTTAERLIQAFNAPGSTRDFIAQNFSAAALQRESAEQRALPLDRLKQRAGGLRAVEIKPQGERMVEVIAATSNGNKFARLVLFTSAKEPGKIADYFILDARDPKRATADAFPTSAVTENQAVRLIKRRLDALTDEDRFSGAILLAHRNKVLLRDARGFADRTWRIPNRPETLFNIASIGKMWTAIAILRLAEEGKLGLDDSVARWVPTYPHRDAAEKITLRMLLQHRAGMGEWDGRRLGLMTSAQAAATMTTAPSEPGKAFGYSNAGYVLLAAAAEKASGLSYEALVEKYVFKPAGMTRSGLWPVAAVIPNRATGYLRPPEDPLGYGPMFANDQYLGAGADGSGGGYSTIDDMFAFHRALADGRLLSKASLRPMIEQAVDFPGTPRPSRYGLGLRLSDCSGAPTLGHSGGGSNSGVSSATYASTDGEWTIIVLGNVDPMPEEVAIDVCELVHRD